MNAITTIDPVQPDSLATRAQSPEAQHFALMQRKAAVFARSPLIPEHLRGKSAEEGVANCYIALSMAEAMGENALIVMQNIHVVKGKAGFAAQYMIARANASGIFDGRIDWRITGKGDDLSITAFATLKATGQEVAVTVDMAMARAEKWTDNAKYRSMPEVMLRYRSATFLVRFYCPEVMLGYRTSDEYEDMAAAAAPPLAATRITAQQIVDQSRGQAELDPAPAEAQQAAAPTSDKAADAFARADGQPGFDLAGPEPKPEPPLSDRISNAATVEELDALVSQIPAVPDEDHDSAAILDLREAASSTRQRLTKARK